MNSPFIFNSKHLLGDVFSLDNNCMKLKSILLFSLVFLLCGCYNSSPNRSNSSSTGTDEDIARFQPYHLFCAERAFKLVFYLFFIKLRISAAA